MDDAPELVHGTCVALGRTAALLRGPSGSGKSDLALRFLFLARRGPAAVEAPILVADDQVELVRAGDRLLARAPATHPRQDGGARRRHRRGQVTWRRRSWRWSSTWCPQADVERLPEDDATAPLLGVEVPLVRLCPWEASAPIKLAVALARAKHI